VDLPDPGPAQPWETRLSSAMWYAIHLLLGGLAMLAILVAAPSAVFLVARMFGATASVTTEGTSMLDAVPRAWGIPAALALIAAVGYLLAGLGALLARVAPALLGPSPADEIARLEA